MSRSTVRGAKRREPIGVSPDSTASATEDMAEDGKPISLEKLEVFSRCLNSSLELSTVLDALEDGISEMLGTRRGAVYLLDPVKELVTCDKAWGVSASYTGAVVEQYRRLPGGTLASQRFTIVEDVASDPRFDSIRPAIEQEGIRSMLLVGLRHQEIPLGALAVYYNTPRNFSQSELHLAQTIANQAAVAIKNAQLYQAAQLRMAELEALRRVSLQLASSLDLQFLMETLIDSMAELVKPSMIHLFLYDERNGQFRLGSAWRDTGERTPVVTTVRPDGITAEAVRRRQPIIIDDAPNHPMYGRNEAETVRAWGVQAIAAFPLVRPSGVMGVLTISYTHPYDITPAVVRITSLVADQAAVALENAYLFALEADRRRLADELRDEVERVRDFNQKLLNSVEAGILLESADDRIEYVNPRLCEIVGYAADELIGKPTEVLLTPEMGRLVDQQAVDRPRGAVGRYEAALLHKDGFEVPVFVNATPMFSGDTFSGTVTAFVDIAERKRTEQTLLALNSAAGRVRLATERAQVYATLGAELGNLGLSMAVFRSRSDDPTLHLEHWSMAPRLRDAEFGALLGKQAIEQLAQAHSERLMALMRNGKAVFVPGREHAAWMNVVVADPPAGFGEMLLRLRTVLVPLVRQQQIFGLLAVVGEDLSLDSLPAVQAFADQASAALDNAYLLAAERHYREQAEAAYQELRDLDRLKDEFVANVSHELRTPLTFIKGYAEYLLEGYAGQVNDDQREALEIVLNRSDAVIQLVNDIISLKRAEMSDLDLEMIDIAEVANGCVQGSFAAAERLGIHIDCVTDPGLAPVRGDALRVGQVFDNLIGNAIKFSGPGDRITVRLSPGPHSVVVSVADTGIGIPADRIDRIWDRFYQIESAWTRRYAGTGLGLTIARRIVEAHGGEIWAQSVPGQGSTFMFTLPT
jgi:PAS domain S-box-containing protein